MYSLAIQCVHIFSMTVFIQKTDAERKKLDCQEYCMEQAVERANKVVEKKTSRVFIPKMKPEEE